MGEQAISRMYRDVRILEIYEGTREIELEIIARSLLGRFSPGSAASESTRSCKLSLFILFIFYKAFVMINGLAVAGSASRSGVWCRRTTQ